MVVDILKTDDGKKAIQEILNDDKLNETLVMDEKTVKETVEKTMTSKKELNFGKSLRRSKIRRRLCQNTSK